MSPPRPSRRTYPCRCRCRRRPRGRGRSRGRRSRRKAAEGSSSRRAAGRTRGSSRSRPARRALRGRSAAAPRDSARRRAGGTPPPVRSPAGTERPRGARVTAPARPTAPAPRAPRTCLARPEEEQQQQQDGRALPAARLHGPSRLPAASLGSAGKAIAAAYIEAGRDPPPLSPSLHTPRRRQRVTEAGSWSRAGRCAPLLDLLRHLPGGAEPCPRPGAAAGAEALTICSAGPAP